MGCVESRDADEEMEDILSMLRKEGRGIYEIPKDGNCLYRAVSHQLDRSSKDAAGSSGTSVPDYKQLRKMAAEFIESHADEFRAFIADCTDEAFAKYLEDVRGRGWGGDLEVNALSRLLRRCIKVYQGNQGIVLSAGF
eukprot:gnl/MRDRNA2_/MRDRNA2_131001_c0_seq1.p1 gnl/MRDRNA2_/MRDRNA2_131001_c0~~gnl/MRDRNA2_/MRDRNA2_131001_c0_seq1.p1  ORF type:complete len:138 (+),score=24.09 gnl/MRDRNA2_/MRDRNA2_131001_c0_seq1:87-500(+)